MPKGISYTIFILVAVFIDALQWAIEGAFVVIGAFSGTIVGAATGAAAAYKLCGLLPTISTTVQYACTGAGGLIGSTVGTFANGPLATAAEPVAATLGFVLGAMVSIVIGGPLIIAMSLEGMSYKEYILTFGTLKMLPIFELFPGWTTFAVLSILKQRSENKTDLLATATKVVAGAARGLEAGPEGALLGAAMAIKKDSKLRTQERQRGRNMNDILVATPAIET